MNFCIHSTIKIFSKYFHAFHHKNNSWIYLLLFHFSELYMCRIQKKNRVHLIWSFKIQSFLNYFLFEVENGFRKVNFQPWFQNCLWRKSTPESVELLFSSQHCSGLCPAHSPGLSLITHKHKILITAKSPCPVQLHGVRTGHGDK